MAWNESLLTDLLAWFPMTEYSGNRIDVHNGNVLTQVGSVLASGIGSALPSGIEENYGYFNASASNFLHSGNTPLVQLSGAFTINAWIYYSTTDYRRYIWGNTADSPKGIWMRTNNGGFETFSNWKTCGFGAAGGTYSGYWLMLSQWNDTNIQRTYINGTERYGEVDNPCGAVASTNTMVVGGYPGAPGDFTGGIAQIAFWDRALSTSEISDLYNSGAGVIYPTAKKRNLMFY